MGRERRGEACKAMGLSAVHRRFVKEYMLPNTGHTGNIVATTWICKVFAKSKKKNQIQM